MSLATAGAVLAVTLLGSTAPYVRSRVDTGVASDPNAHCFWWEGGSTLTYHQSQAGNAATTGDTEFTAIRNAFSTWQQVMDQCGSLKLVEGTRVASRDVGYDQSTGAVNQNLILFRDISCDLAAPSGDPCRQEGFCGNKYDCWWYPTGTIALTTSTYDTNTGKLYDSDVEFNAARFVFTAVDSPVCTSQPYSQNCVAYDVQNTMTHEAGHVIGLDHTDAPGSVMNPTAPAGETSKRSIDSGSRSFVCDVYPQGRQAVDCVASKPKPTGGCSATGAAGTGLLGAAVVALGLVRALRRRPCRGSP
jgi:hypothetical protein